MCIIVYITIMISYTSNAPPIATPPIATPPIQTNNDWCEDDFYVIN